MISVAPFSSVVSSIAQKVLTPSGGRGRGILGAAVVEMPGLCGFAGLQVDREQCRQQAALAQFRLDERHDQRMHYEFGKSGDFASSA